MCVVQFFACHGVNAYEELLRRSGNYYSQYLLSCTMSVILHGVSHKQSYTQQTHFAIQTPHHPDGPERVS